jgi:Ca2+-binding RTX toxin-like protein
MTYFVFKGTSGNDCIFGTDDDDVIDGGAGADILWGFEGNDWLVGGADNDFLFGMGGDDWLYGGEGTDFLYGGDGHNIFIGGDGPDYLNGSGSSFDTASYSDSDSAVFVSLDGYADDYGNWIPGPIAKGGTAEGDVLVGIENLTGSDYGDKLVGDYYYNKLIGGFGEDTLDGAGADDILDGGDGVDTLLGGDGNDTLKGGADPDELNGGEDNDTADYSDSFDSISVSLQSGVGKGGAAQGDHLVDIENLVGGFNDDILEGNSDDNVLDGMSGDDTLQGFEGADELSGGDGSDTASYEGSKGSEDGFGVFVMLADNKAYGGHAEGDTFSSIENVTGSDYVDTLLGTDDANVLKGMNGGDTLSGLGGADTLDGGGGDDTLIGGLDVDTMYGADGADTFTFLSEKECGTSIATADYLADFEESMGDRIDLSGIDADPSTERSNEAFTFIGNNVDFTGVGQVRYNEGYVEGNTDGDLDPEFYIKLDIGLTPEMHDYGFIL